MNQGNWPPKTLALQNTHISGSTPEPRPPPMQLPPIYVGYEPPLPPVSGDGTGKPKNPGRIFLGFDPDEVPGGVVWNRTMFQPIRERTKVVEREYEAAAADVETYVQQELDALKSAQGNVQDSNSEGIAAELARHDALIGKKNSERQKQAAQANAITGGSLIGADADFFSNELRKFDRQGKSYDEALASWNASVAAAYTVQLLEKAIQSLNARRAPLNASLAAALAQEAEAKQIADEQVRLDAEAKQLVKEQALKAANSFKFSLSAPSTLNTATGIIEAGEGIDFELESSIKAALLLLRALGSIGLAPATAVGLFALLYSPSLGNSDRYPPTSLNVPMGDLGADLPDNLSEIAAAGGTVTLPYRIYGDHSKYSLIATHADGPVSPDVPVRLLSFDPVQNAYTYTTADTPPITLVFPIAEPGNSSTQTPAQPVLMPVYTGLTLKPVEIEASPFPGFDEWDIRDAIYTFPKDSGLPPIYVVFSEPLDSGIFTRKQLDRKFKHAGDFGVPDTKKNWKTLTEFRDAIEQHLSDVGTVEKGVYRRMEGSRVFFNSRTMNVVVLKADGDFVSGWKIVPEDDVGRIYLETGEL